MQTLCNADEVPVDEPLRVVLEDGHAVAVFLWEGSFYCTDDACSHGEASLSEGYIEDAEIVCPYHMGSFCIFTGEARAAPCSEAVATYAVTVKGGVLWVDR